MAFGVQPIIKFGSEILKEKVLPDLLLGRKRCCVAITEPEAVSDVAGIQTTAIKTMNGKYYLISVTKRWSSHLKPPEGGAKSDCGPTGSPMGSGRTMPLWLSELVHLARLDYRW